MTLDAFFQTVREKETDNGVVLVAMNFLNGLINGCIGDNVLEAYNEWKKIKMRQNQDKSSIDLPRMVNVDFSDQRFHAISRVRSCMFFGTRRRTFQTLHG